MNNENISSSLVIAPNPVAVNLVCSLPFRELNRLYRAIENINEEKPHSVIQFASAYNTEEASVIAFDVAVVAALAGKRVLYIDTIGGVKHETAKKLNEALKFSLNSVFTNNKPLGEVMVSVDKSNLFYTVLRSQNENAVNLNDLMNFEILLNSLRNSYDLVIIDAVNFMNNTLALSITKATDGVIIVIEAEKTRVPVANQLKKVIEESGGKVIGAIFNKRRFYIPKFLYRLLYKN
jgi:Mrp family chromosome partitioning ATPase